jgi:hypothetical protein
VQRFTTASLRLFSKSHRGCYAPVHTRAILKGRTFTAPRWLRPTDAESPVALATRRPMFAKSSGRTSSGKSANGSATARPVLPAFIENLLARTGPIDSHSTWTRFRGAGSRSLAV